MEFIIHRKETYFGRTTARVEWVVIRVGDPVGKTWGTYETLKRAKQEIPPGANFTIQKGN